MRTSSESKDKRDITPFTEGRDFEWHVATEHDYSIVQARRQPPAAPLPGFSQPRPEPFLLSPDQKEYLVSSYKPTEDYPLLYREFPRVITDKASVLEFACKYGELGIHKLCTIESNGENKPIWGESVADWIRAKDLLAITLDLWDATNVNDVEKLERQLRWQTDDESSTLKLFWEQPHGTLTRGGMIITSTNTDVPLVKHLESLKVPQLAKYVVTHLINKSIARHSKGMLRFDSVSDLEKSPTFHAMPSSLLGCFWHQLAQEVAREMLYFECLFCGKPELKPIKRGQPSKTCSATCRVKLSQHKSKKQSS